MEQLFFAVCINHVFSSVLLKGFDITLYAMRKFLIIFICKEENNHIYKNDSATRIYKTDTYCCRV